VLRFPVRFHPLRFDGPDMLYEDQRLSVQSFPLKHTIPVCGFIFREKNPPRKVPVARSYAYCSDTGYSEEIVPWIHGAGLLYHEATFMQDKAANAAVTLHSTAAEAAAIASLAQVGKLLIGHFSARYEDIGPLLAEARAVFPATQAAEEGVVINI
jgi:ribonuclease Z